MKKTTTLLLAIVAVVGVNAQTPKDEARKVVLRDKKSSQTSSSTPRDIILGDKNGDAYPAGSREAEIDRVNRDYDEKIAAVRRQPLLSKERKETMVRQLEEDRARKIREINARYRGSRDNKYEDREYKRSDRDKEYKGRDKEYKKYKKAKSNNGKHLGWEKGKGNPHRTGGKVKKNKN